MNAVELVKALMENIDWSPDPEAPSIPAPAPKEFYIRSSFDGDTMSWFVYHIYTADDHRLYRACWSQEEALEVVREAGGTLVPAPREVDEAVDWTPDPDAPAFRAPGTQGLDEGIDGVVRDAHELYQRLRKSGVLAVVEKSGVDDDSIAQALLQIAIEQRGSPGGRKAYRLFKKHGEYVL